MGGTEMAAPAHQFFILQNKLETGPDVRNEDSREFYQGLRREVEAFILSLKQRYYDYIRTAPQEVQRSHNPGLHVLPVDKQLFVAAVDLHQSVVNKLSYCSDYQIALRDNVQDPHAFASAGVNPPWQSTSRTLYRVDPPPTDARMPRYGYGFK